MEAFLHHQRLTLCQEIMLKEEKREGGEDARRKESPALQQEPGSRGECRLPFAHSGGSHLLLSLL